MQPRTIALAAAFIAVNGFSAAFVLAQTQPQGAGGMPFVPQPIQRNQFPATVGQFNPSNPATTVSTTAVMAGTGSTCIFTPKYSTNVRVEFYGTAANATSGDGVGVQGVFGTGTAPANGAAASGTTWSPVVQAISSAANAPEEIYVSGHLTGLTIGTAYWLDLQQKAVTGGTAALTSLQCAFNEE